MSNYRKTMTEALREMYSLDESVIDKVKEIASKKQAMKIDGVMVDSFTASAISQIYDKVNDANKKKMDSLPITKLANLAFKMMQKNDYVPEEVELDEAKYVVVAKVDGKLEKITKPLDKKQAEMTAKRLQKDMDIAIGKYKFASDIKIQKEEVDLDEADDFKPHMMYDPKTGKGYKADTMDDHLRMKKMGYNHDAPKTEEVDLDEAVKHMEVPPDGPRGRGVPMAHPERIGYDSKENQQAYNSTTHGTPDNQIDTAKHFMKKGLKGKKLHKAVADHHDVIHVDVHKQLNHDKKKLHPLHMSFVGEDLDEVDRSTYSDRMKKYTAMLKDAEKEKPLDKEWIKLLKRRIKSESDDERKKLGMSEDVDLDEGKMQDMWQKKNAQSLSVGPFELLRGKSGVHTIKRSGKVLGDFSYDSDADNFVANMKGMKGQWTGNDIDSLFTHLQKVHKEEVELDENKLKDLVIKGQDLEAYAKKSGGIDKKDMMNVAAMLKKGDKSGALKYAKKLDTDPKEYILNLMGEEVEVEESAASDARRAMRRDPEMRQRAFSKDNSATDDDVKGASKNIMMQMRKAQSLNGRFDVEFADGKKVKIPAKMAIAVQQKYNKMRRPAEKEKFQAKIAKSYRDMLSALKEAVSPAQQAAIAISKKERGEKPKKESVLDRIDKKLKEKKDG